jgi:hypothetical protein
MLVTRPLRIVSSLRVKTPPVSTEKIRKSGILAAVLLSMVAPFPLMIMALMITGNPLFPKVEL